MLSLLPKKKGKRKRKKNFTYRQVQRPRRPQRRGHGLQRRRVPRQSRRQSEQSRREDDGHDSRGVDLKGQVRRPREASRASRSGARGARATGGGPVPRRVVDRDLALCLLHVDHAQRRGEEGEAVKSEGELVGRGERGGGVRGRRGCGLCCPAAASGGGGVGGDFRRALVCGLRQGGADRGRERGGDVGSDEDGGPVLSFEFFFQVFLFLRRKKISTTEEKIVSKLFFLSLFPPFLPVADLELRDDVSNMDQNHRPGHQRGPRGDRPLGAPVLYIGPHITQLARRLRRSKDEGEPALVELEAGLALRALLPLELFEGREGGGEELEDDGGVDVGDDSVVVFVVVFGWEREIEEVLKESERVFRKKEPENENEKKTPKTKTKKKKKNEKKNPLLTPKKTARRG